MALWRCLNCKKEFEAGAAACADCELDPAKNPRDAEYFARLECIHLDPPTKVAGRGKNHAACNPSLRGVPLTSEPKAVTCDKCKATEVFAAANGNSNGISAALFVKKKG